MNARERYLSIYDDDARKHLDRVPTFVQYLRQEFIAKNRKNFKDANCGIGLRNDYFKFPFLLGFDSVFAPFPLSIKIKSAKIKTDLGEVVRIGEDGQKINRKTEYYEGGYIHSLDILNKLIANKKDLDLNLEIEKVMENYAKISDQIYPILTIDGIFDRVWKSMGFDIFSRHFQKASKLYKEIINYYAELTCQNIESFINSYGDNDNVITILDDFAYKSGPMISPERWEKDFLPHYKKINNLISKAGMIPQIHSDGDPTVLIPLLRKAGFRGLQGWEGGSDPKYINEHFPDFVVIGFGDVSEILPFGSKQQVTNHVRNLIDIFKENRHFIIGPSTVIFEKIPLNNVNAFIIASREYGKY
jgi:hypothetical protein